MFPLTRLSFTTFLSLILCTLCVGNWQSPLFAQEEDGAAAPATEPDNAEDWTPPDWWMDSDTAEKYRRSRKLNVAQHMRANPPSNQQVQELKELAHYYLSLMTHKENRANIPKDVVIRMNSEILNTSNRAPGRIPVLDELIAKSDDLLKHPSDVVKVNTVLMLSQLSIEPANFQAQTPARPYPAAAKKINSILADSQMIPGARVAAARGLGRICQDDQINSIGSALRSDIAKTLVDALKATPTGSSDDVWWFRYRAIDSLGFVGRMDLTGGEPAVINALMEVLANPKEELIVRCQAAVSISRLPLSGSTNVQLITHEIAQLLLRLCSEYQKNPTAHHWRDYFARIYISFRPETQAEADQNRGLLYQIRRGGLGTNSTYVEAAFFLALPIIKAMVESEEPGPLPANAVKKLQDWAKQNKPSNRKVTPSSPDLPD